MKVALFGTNYGATYLHPLLSNRRTDLVAIGSRGSRRSRELAKLVEVPHYVDDKELVATERPDAAIVAIPNADALILRLLGAGVNVLAEHPVTPPLAKKAFAAARAKRLVFAINAHFSDLAAPLRFISLCRAAGRPRALMLDVHTRAVYSAFDILERALGRRVELAGAKAIVGRGSTKAAWTPAAVVATCAGIPFSLQLPAGHALRDDGSDHVVLHRISIAFARETITLVDTFGPVVRTLKLNTRTTRAPMWRVASAATSLDKAAADRSEANARVLRRFVSAIGGKADSRELRSEAERSLSVARSCELVRRLTKRA